MSTQMIENEEICKKERKHFEDVCNSFRQYATFMKYSRMGKTKKVELLPLKQQKVLPRWMIPNTTEHQERQKILQEAELRNQFFFDCMLKHAGQKNSQDYEESLEDGSDIGYVHGQRISWASQDTMDKVSSVLRSIARDWSKEGASERSMSYKPILDSIRRYVPVDTAPIPPRVLVPGAGLGRLALEIYSLGYEVQGNEFSLHMLLASDFILNACTSAKPFFLSPYLQSSKNVSRSVDPARQLIIPDCDPASSLQSHMIDAPDDAQPDFSMAAGEFIQIYSREDQFEKWDVLASCFFLDTAPSVVEYIQVIYHLLKPGGLLVNFGPLHFHWSGPPLRPDSGHFDSYLKKNSFLDSRYLQSIDISWEDIREILYNCGFEVLEERVGMKSRYAADARSLRITDYRCIYFVARKVQPT